MKRFFYLSVGVAVGIYVSHRLTRAAQVWTPAGVADSAVGLGSSLRELAEEIRADAARRETELRETIGLDDVARTAKPPVVERNAGGV